MNIGIDATSWLNNRGFGRFTRELLVALFALDCEHKFHLFVDQPIDDLSDFPNVTVSLVDSSKPTTEAAVANGSRSPFDMYKMYRAVAAADLDIMFYPAVYSWFPSPRRLPTMVTVMDAIAEHYPQLIFTNWKSRLFWTIKVKLAIWNSQRILTISKAAKAEIIEYIGAPEHKIDIAGAAPNPDFRRTSDTRLMRAARQRALLPEDAPFIVYVGGLAPHKNLDGLLDGFERALEHDSVKPLHIALVGDFKGAGFRSNYESLRARVEASESLRGRVHFSGYISDEDLVALYSCALAVAMPSYSEGFGLPAIEAMACGAPVLSSTLGSLPEVVGDAGIYFDPFNIPQIGEAITQMVEDEALRAQLVTRALERAPQFTWERVATITLKHLEGLTRA